MKDMKTKHVALLVYRQDKIPVDTAVVVRAECLEELSIKDFVTALRRGVTKWAQETTDGRGLYYYAGSDMNIGDLSTYDLSEIVARCPEIISLEIEGLEISESFVYDTSLCEELLDDEN